ncbi:MAG: serine/threonine-protein kinase [Dehalococcoidia bacterium]
MATPDHVGRYEIERVLGRGGWATVYLARDPRLGRQVAIKLLAAHLAEGDETRARFAREARTLASLDHPAVVRIHDFDDQDGQPYLVSAYMPGGSLGDLLGSGPVTQERAIAILQRIAGALDYAHEAGIVHRDVAPANILFDASGNACLADFGIARGSLSATSLTHGASIGTPAYMSPEQAAGTSPVTPASDIYSLGVVAFEMLSGRRPFVADEPFALMRMHLQDAPPSLAAHSTAFSDDVDAVLSCCLSKDPGARFASANAFVGALAAALRHNSMAVTHGTPLGPRPESERPEGKDEPTRSVAMQTLAVGPPGRRRRPAVAVTAFLLVLLVLGVTAAGLAIAQSGDPEGAASADTSGATGSAVQSAGSSRPTSQVSVAATPTGRSQESPVPSATNAPTATSTATPTPEPSLPPPTPTPAPTPAPTTVAISARVHSLERLNPPTDTRFLLSYSLPHDLADVVVARAFGRYTEGCSPHPSCLFLLSQTPALPTGAGQSVVIDVPPDHKAVGMYVCLTNTATGQCVTDYPAVPLD